MQGSKSIGLQSYLLTLLRKCLEWVWRVQIPSEDVFGVLGNGLSRSSSCRGSAGASRPVSCRAYLPPSPHRASLLPERRHALACLPPKRMTEPRKRPSMTCQFPAPSSLSQVQAYQGQGALLRSFEVRWPLLPGRPACLESSVGAAWIRPLGENSPRNER